MSGEKLVRGVFLREHSPQPFRVREYIYLPEKYESFDEMREEIEAVYGKENLTDGPYSIEFIKVKVKFKAETNDTSDTP